MNKLLVFLILAWVGIWANDGIHTFAKNEACKNCHPAIYKEYMGSMHANSTPQKDTIHAAVWAKHPQNLKQHRYGCGKCHTPAADNLDKMLTKGQKALPETGNPTHQDGIACAYCHRIRSIRFQKTSNTNIISKRPKAYFGTRKEHIASPFHDIITEGNDHMKNGNVCIGCHSHKRNKWGLNVCSTNIANEMDSANCVSCHMPKVEGSVSNLKPREKHAFHGFAGSHFHADMLAKYVDISMLRNIDHFIVNIDNRTSHALLLHPLRIAVLKVSVFREGKRIGLPNRVFVRVIGKEGKPAMPWQATETVKDTMIKANEKRPLRYDVALQKGDEVHVVLGYFLVHPNAARKLGIDNDPVVNEFHILKKAIFKI